jgi:antitoxin component YwqK of YwqJK toxin-antitoxin module
MSRLLIFVLVSLGLSLQAQIKLHISDSLVVYSPDYGYPENDSLVFIQKAGEITFCEAYQVYFDTKWSQLAYESYSKGDTCTVVHYWRNGKLKRKTLHIKIEGSPVWWYEEIYCSNGALLFKGPSPNQPGVNLMINYYCNGNKRNEFYHNGSGAEGKMTWWHENGQIQSECFFENNEPTGTWKYYDERGKLERTERYEKGVLIKIEEANKK